MIGLIALSLGSFSGWRLVALLMALLLLTVLLGYWTRNIRRRR